MKFHFIGSYAQVHVLRYENLKMQLVPELQNLMDFLDLEYDEELTACIKEKATWRSFKRPKAGINYKMFYTRPLRKLIEKAKKQVYAKAGLLKSSVTPDFSAQINEERLAFHGRLQGSLRTRTQLKKICMV